jgi:hypothetical protein
MITDLALTGVAIVVFLIMAELAWRPFQRRHIDRPLPTDPAAQAANIGGIIGGGCIVLAFVAVVAVAVLAALLMAADAVPMRTVDTGIPTVLQTTAHRAVNQ